MKYFRSLLAVLFLFAFSSTILSQSVDDIVSKHIEALGGLDKINAVKTLKFTGKFMGMGAEIPVVLYIKVKDKVKFEMSFQGMAMVQAYDGTTGWNINPFSGKKDAEKMTADQSKEMKEQAEWEGQLVNYKDKGYKVELLGKEDVEGTDTYKLKVTDKDGDITYHFLDASSYLEIKSSSTRKFKEKEVTQETYPSNYQKIEGIMFPMAMEIKSPGRDESQKGTFDKIELNTDMDDSIFKMPEPKK